MKIVHSKALPLPGVHLLRFARFADDRGYFTETFRRSDFEAIDFLRGLDFVQCNESYSRAGVLRGLHFQWSPYMGKLVRTVSGRMLDLVLDIRKGSATWGKALAVEITADPEARECDWIWVPPGFAHGNLFTQPTTIEYFCTGEYSPGNEAAISPLAPDLDWSLCEPHTRAAFEAAASEAVVSDKDRQGLTLAQWLDDDRSENFLFGSC